MNQLKQTIPLLVVLALLAGCATLFSGVVTTTSVVDTAMKAWAEVSANGKSTPALDAKVTNAHNQYRKAAGIAQEALVAYKQSGDQADYLKAFNVVKATAADLIAMIVPLINPDKANKLQTDLAKATTI